MLNSIVVVDDSEADRYIIERVVKRAKVADKVIPFGTGYEALEWLEDVDRFEREAGPWPPPVLILLDIKMPRVDGFDVLEELRQRVGGGEFPDSWFAVVMLTSSRDERDRKRAAQFEKVVDYVIKPLDADTAERIAQRIVSLGT